MISVCIATYNGGQYILEQLSSILRQLDIQDEIIISDDLSTDNTIELIRSLNDSRIKIITNSKNIGCSKNFERAILEAKGDIIFISDQDDVWLENKVSLYKSRLEYVDLVIGDVSIVNKELEIIDISHFKKFNTKHGFLNNFLKTRYIGASMAFKRSILEKVLPFPQNYTYCQYDYWLAIVAEYFYKTEMIKVPTMLYRRHGNNLSTGGEKSKISIIDKIFTRLYCLSKLLMRK